VEQAQQWVEFCRKLLQLLKDHCFIKRIVTCDKKLIYVNNPDLQKQWLDKEHCQCRLQRESASKKSSSASGGTTKVLFIMNFCRPAVRSTWRYILNNFAQKVPSASELKVCITSVR
jgi:hypothetical protein